MIERAIQTILVDLLIPELKQIGKCRAPVPIFSNVQLARWLTEPRRHQHRRHLRPGNALLPHRQQPFAQILKPNPAPQCQRQIHIAELTRTLDADAPQPNRHRDVSAAVIKQLRLLGNANQMTRQRPRLNSTLLIQFAQMRHCLLDDAPADTNTAHQPPVTVNLAVLLANRTAQIHAPSEPTAPPKKTPKVGTTRPNQLRALPNLLI